MLVRILSIQIICSILFVSIANGQTEIDRESFTTVDGVNLIVPNTFTPGAVTGNNSSIFLNSAASYTQRGHVNLLR